MRTSIATLAAAAVVSLGLASPADAAFVMRFDVGNDGTFETTITDNGTGDSDARVGVILFNGSSGAFTVHMTMGVSKPIFDPNTPMIDMVNMVVTTSAAGGTIAIELTDTDFSAPINQPVEFSFGGTTRGTVAFTGGGGTSNTEFDLTNSVTPVVVPGGGSSFSGSGYAPGGSTTNPFSMTIRAVIIHGGAASTSFDAELRSAPAPAGALLLAAGLPCLAAGYLRRRKAAAA